MKTSDEQESEAVWAALRESSTASEPGSVEDPSLGVTDECPEPADHDDLEAGDREELEGDGDDDD
jgi:hypothetical protein